MGFYIRKSLRVGPLRFNLSKSGIGASVGIKGFRLGTGPRGNYVHAGVGGVYYRKTLNSKNSGHKPQDANELIVNNDLESIDSNMDQIFEDSTSDSLVAEISQKNNKFNSWKWVCTITISLILFVHPYFLFSLLLVPLAFLYDDMRKSVVIFYNFDEETEKKYKALLESFELAKKAKKIWHIEAKQDVNDAKYNAGADTLIKRSGTALSLTLPRFLKVNIPVPNIKVGKEVLCFFPDKLLVLAKSKAGTVIYNDLEIQVNSSRFIEEDSVPKDAKVVGTTWKYVNKKGGPDRRFKDNREIPICEYENVQFFSHSGLNERIQLSKLDSFAEFQKTIGELSSRVA
jgi:hypothetical protein